MEEKKLNIALVIIATGNYINFIPSLYESIKKYFFVSHNLEVFLFTDDLSFSDPGINKIFIKNEPWPFSTFKTI